MSLLVRFKNLRIKGSFLYWNCTEHPSDGAGCGSGLELGSAKGQDVESMVKDLSFKARLTNTYIISLLSYGIIPQIFPTERRLSHAKHKKKKKSEEVKQDLDVVRKYLERAHK